MIEHDVPEPARAGRRGFGLTVVGVGVAVFAFAARTLWDQVGSHSALVVFSALVVMAALDCLVAFRTLAHPVVHVIAPAEAFVDEDTPLRVVVHGVERAATLTIVSMRGSPTVRLDRSRGPVLEGVVPVRPPVRSRIVRVIVELNATGPLGFVTCHRRVAVPFPAPVHAAPRAGVGPPVLLARPPGSDADPATGTDVRRLPDVGEPRGVRPYVPGDPRRLVHWPATARTGALSVRELDRERRQPDLVVALELLHPGDDAERAVARCRAVVEEAWRDGRSVRLRTIEPGAAPLPGFDPNVLSPRRRAVRLEQVHALDGAVEDRAVRTPSDLHRRLSRAAFGLVGPPGHPAGRVADGPASGTRVSAASGAAPDLYWVTSTGDDGWRA